MTEDISTKIDRGVEFTIHNLRGGVEDYFGIKKRTAERILGLIATSTDIYLDSSLHNTTVSVILYIVYMHIFPEQIPRKNNNSDTLALSMTSPTEIIKFIRLLSLSITLIVSFMGKFDSFSILVYLHYNFHNNDDRGIKNWAKGQLKKLRKSIKIPGLQPSPT